MKKEKRSPICAGTVEEEEVPKEVSEKNQENSSNVEEMDIVENDRKEVPGEFE